MSSPDLHRRLRRNHYPEEPGFLFLAALNGRPSRDGARPGVNRLRQRMRAVRRAGEVGLEPVVELMEVA